MYLKFIRSEFPVFESTSFFSILFLVYVLHSNQKKNKTDINQKNTKVSEEVGKFFYHSPKKKKYKTNK